MPERLEPRIVLSARSLLFPQLGDGPGQVTDTYVDYDFPTTSYAAAASLFVDQSSGLAQRQQTLIRFDDLFGSGTGQIRPDDTIVSATLNLESEGYGGGGVMAYRMLQAWSDTATWSSLGNGIQWDDVEALATPDATVNAFSSWSSVSIDITSSLHAWQADPASNFGWMLTSTTSTKGNFGSSESPASERRPVLRVQLERAAALVSVSAVDPLAFEGTSPGAFVISRTDTEGDLVVPYVLGGTATAGTDYRSLPGSVTIPAGSRSAIVTVVPLEDGVAESPESVTLQITSSATIETDLATASITIRDAFAGSGGLVVPLDETFTLQSLPGARHTIYLDFLGSNQVWGSWNSGRPIDTPPYDLDGDPSTFSDAELIAIQQCWLEMTEDFLPFEVNVTTVLPAPGQLAKTAASDLEWGIRVIFGKSTNWDLGAGGKAYLDSFSDDFDNPAWVQGASGVIASHEVGHALGLNHDGDPEDEYYPGHGSGETFWGPLMGGTYEGLSQWDRGTYPGADNQEDDLLIITTQNGFGYRADDHADLSVNASELVTFGDATGRWYAEGNIERNTDVDWFRFTVGAGRFEITVDPLATIGNLDVRADLFDAAGTLIATSNPVNELSASFTESLSAGTYFVRVDGDGNPDPTSPGYDDYGSLGFYTVQVAPAATILTFQQDVAGYTGTSDTSISRDFASTSRATETELLVDGRYSRYSVATLLRFGDIFGDADWQVPPDALLASATLDLNFLDPGAGFTVHRMLRDWSDTDTYASLADGVVADDVEAAAEVVATSEDFVEGWYSLDITAAVTAWLADPTSNDGLLFQPGAETTNGNDIASSESSTPPRLTIRFLPGPQNEIVVEVGAGDTQTDPRTYANDETIVKRGDGTLILANPNSHSGGLRVEAGTVIIQNVAALNGGPLAIQPGGTVLLDVGTALVNLASLNLDPAARLDVGSGGIRVGSGGFDITAIRQSLIDGRNGGSWNGTKGITYSRAGASDVTASATSSAVGYIVDNSGVLSVRYTSDGDAQLDGKVDFDDILALFPNYGVAGSYVWADGDFTYDGRVDFDDILALFPNYGGASAFGNGLFGSGLAGGSGNGSSTGGGDGGGDAGTNASGGGGSASGQSVDSGSHDGLVGPEAPSTLPPRSPLKLSRTSDAAGNGGDATSLVFAALAVESGARDQSGTKKPLLS